MSVEIAYADTNPYRDWFEWRTGKRPYINQAEDAKEFFSRVEAGEFILAVSDHLDYQLKGFPQYDALKKNLGGKGLLVSVNATSQDKAVADMEASSNNTSFDDALHFVMALKAGATWLVTQNEMDFAPFRDRIKVRQPRLVGLF